LSEGLRCFYNLLIKNSSSIPPIRRVSFRSFIKKEKHGEEKLLAQKPHKINPQKGRNSTKILFF
jgi:hypothetical protein